MWYGISETGDKLEAGSKKLLLRQLEITRETETTLRARKGATRGHWTVRVGGVVWHLGYEEALREASKWKDEKAMPEDWRPTPTTCVWLEGLGMYPLGELGKVLRAIAPADSFPRVEATSKTATQICWKGDGSLDEAALKEYGLTVVEGEW